MIMDGNVYWYINTHSDGTFFVDNDTWSDSDFSLRRDLKPNFFFTEQDAKDVCTALNEYIKQFKKKLEDLHENN